MPEEYFSNNVSDNKELKSEEIDWDNLPPLSDIDVSEEYPEPKELENGELKYIDSVLNGFHSDVETIVEELDSVTAEKDPNDAIIKSALARIKIQENDLEYIIGIIAQKKTPYWEHFYDSLLRTLDNLIESPGLGIYDKECREFALNFIEKNAEVISAEVSRGRLYGLDSMSFGMIERLMQSGSVPRQRIKAREIFDEIEDNVLYDLSDEHINGIEDKIVSILKIYSFDSDKIFSIVKSKLYSEKANVASWGMIMLGKILLESLDEGHGTHAREMVVQYIKDKTHLSFDLIEILLDAWLAVGRNKFEYVLPDNIVAVMELEKKSPGSVEFLYKEYGIKIFGRYPVDMLIKQVQFEGDTNIPHGVVVYPESDHNGAFYGTRSVFSDLDKQLSGEYIVRFSEAKNSQDLLYRIYNSSKKFGKISFAIIGGHGTKHSIQFGEMSSSKDSHLKIEDLNLSGVSKTSRHFIDKPTFILVSCNTGQEEGISQKGSDVILGATFLAPAEATNLEKIIVSGVRNRDLHFGVKYYEGETKEYFSGKDSKK